MRVRLKEDKQKQLIYEFKINKELTWRELANKLNISEGVLKDYKNEKLLLPLNIFNKLSKNEKHIVELKEDNWGQSKGGINSKGNTKTINFPEKSIELSELCGIILGDGNINRTRKGKHVSVNQIKIAGHSINDKEYLTLFVKPILENLFKIKTREYAAKNARCHYIIVDSIELIKFFNSVGLKSGNKIKNNQGIPNWILENQNYLKVCIRGLIDTDGSIHRMSKRDKNLLRISFTSHIPKLFRDVLYSLKLLGYTPHIIRSKKIYLSRQSEIKRYIKEIGFSNQKHLKRFKEFQNI